MTNQSQCNQTKTNNINIWDVSHVTMANKSNNGRPTPYSG